MTKFSHWNLFGGSEMELSEGPQWKISEPATSPTRQQLEHSLATGFIKLQKERDPAARQAQWVELQRLASELERLGESNE